MRRGLRLATLTVAVMLSAALVLAAGTPAGSTRCTGRPDGSIWCHPI